MTAAARNIARFFVEASLILLLAAIANAHKASRWASRS